ncbi:PepSY domain-containing protein [Acetobacter sp.]|uniref:PepSY-associated TM helix domain-containing protein n=1 Tax=Acetobacter sp. TaxID=440 RepID=UPI00258A5D17|nr:PepSY-associated TM helix domain-containing protein [Acetobacter sp.]MCC6104738.1 PepSY domain-containing protein [Acetobacter sp.]
MRETFRVHMGWLHSWVGFLAGLVLTCIFATGTLSVFDKEITQWMQPEVTLDHPPDPTPLALQRAAETTMAEQEKDLFAFITLPSLRDPVIRVLHYDGHEFIGPVLDPVDGHIFPARATAGGQFFYDFHFALRNGPVVGCTIVTLLGVCLLVAVGSGIAIHIKAMWPDLILFRPFGPRPRAWLDAHLVTGVLFLPFLIMMAYTGTVIRARGILPPHPFLPAQQTEAPPPAAASPPAKTNVSAPPASAVRPPTPPLGPLIAQAQQILQAERCELILFSPTQIRIFRSDDASLFLTRDLVTFSRADGHVISSFIQKGAAARTLELLHGLHYARFSSALLRWLYFLSGLACTVLMGSGLVLFLMKRRKASGQKILFRTAEGLTIGVLVGLPLAITGLFWANRLLPLSMDARMEAEIQVFFMLWAFSALHGLICALRNTAYSGWRAQLAVLVFMALGLPVVDGLTHSHGWLQDAGRYYTLDALAMLSGLAALIVFRKLRRQPS